MLRASALHCQACQASSEGTFAFAAGATDAARGAADIVLTRPGLSVIVSAIIGARKIFQRMTTYSKYTVAMTFRVCFTFGLLTVIYNWCAVRSYPSACMLQRLPQGIINLQYALS